MIGFVFVAATLFSPRTTHAQSSSDSEGTHAKSCCPAPTCVMPKDYQCIYGDRRYPDVEDSVRIQTLGFHYFCGEKVRSCVGGRVCEKGEFVAYFCRRKGQKGEVNSERDLPRGFYLVHTDPQTRRDAGADVKHPVPGPTATPSSTAALPVDAGVDAGAPTNTGRASRAKRSEGSLCSVALVGRRMPGSCTNAVALLALLALRRSARRACSEKGC